ncbi:MAG: hypothetical protein AAB438_03930 [Patescibacteria group bacterium]
MTWALRRQLIYISILVLFFGGLGFWISYPYINKPPTCFDNTQNGTEAGVDCGGSCALACSFQVDKISVTWARVFKVVHGRFNAVAYLENHNKDTAIYRIKYKFRFADKDNVYIGKREGETYIPPRGKFAIFEPAIDLGNSVPVFTSFEFTEEPVWVKVPEEKVNQLNIFVSDIQLKDEDTAPKLFATIKNDSFFMIPELKPIAILYDNLGNAISVSSTYIDLLKGKDSMNISFTWPEPFQFKVVTKEVIPMYDIFSVKLK